MIAPAAGGPEPVTEIVPGIQRITQRLGARDLHLYLVMGERPLLVDTGLELHPRADHPPRPGAPRRPPQPAGVPPSHPRGRRPLRGRRGDEARRATGPAAGPRRRPALDRVQGRPSSPRGTVGTPPTAWTTTPRPGPGSATIWAPTPRWTPPWRAATGWTWGATGCRCSTSPATRRPPGTLGSRHPRRRRSGTPSSSGASTMSVAPCSVLRPTSPWGPTWTPSPAWSSWRQRTSSPPTTRPCPARPWPASWP